MAPQFIYVMKDLRKVVPPSREILRGIWLSFYPGAKIGVLGGNGAGKSTLLKSMAGVDQDFQGEAWPHQGTKIGYLSQVPELDPKKNVQQNVEDAVKEQRALLKQFEDISMQFAEPMTDEQMEKLLEMQGRVQEQIDAHNLWELDRKIEIAMDALRLPPGDAAVTNLSGGEKRRVALCRTLLEEPDMLLLEPGCIVAFPRNSGSAIELENPLRDVVEEITIVRDGDDCSRKFCEIPLEPRD